MSNPLFDLSGQVALITGSSRGIGRAIAEEMSAAGAKVVISSRKLEACDQVRDAIRERGGEAISLACNIGRKEEVEGLAKAALDQLGRIDILVCNAAVNPFYGSLTKLDDDAWDKTMISNVKSSLVAGQARRTAYGGARFGQYPAHLQHRCVQGFLRARCLRYFQGRRGAAGAKPRAGTRPQGHSRQCHCAGAR